MGSIMLDREVLEEIIWSQPGEPSAWEGLEHPMQIMESKKSNVEQYHYDCAVVYQYPPGKFWRLTCRMGHEGDHEFVSHEAVSPRAVTAVVYE